MTLIKKVLSLMSLLFCCDYGYSQSSVLVGGGNAYVEGVGELSVSVGQLDFQYAESDWGNVTAGMQQSVLILPDNATRTSFWGSDDMSISIAPIPTHDVCHFSIRGGNKDAYDFILTDLNGKILLKGCASNGYEVDLSSFYSGIYLLKVDLRDLQKSFVTFKVIKD